MPSESLLQADMWPRVMAVIDNDIWVTRERADQNSVTVGNAYFTLHDTYFYTRQPATRTCTPHTNVVGLLVSWHNSRAIGALCIRIRVCGGVYVLERYHDSSAVCV